MIAEKVVLASEIPHAMISFILNTIAALLLGFFWLRFFRQVDAFEKESWKASLACLGLGLLSPLITLIISPFFGDVFDQESTSGLLGYAIIQVAAVEEFSKILPFLFILYKTRWVNESIDFIKYPALSAIGFATTENILYAMEHGMEVLQYRAVLSFPGHLFFSMISGWFLHLGMRQSGGFPAPWFFAGYLIGVLAHGLYDFFLFTGEWASILSIALAAVFAFYIKKMIFWTIRDSEFFDEKKLPEIFRAGRFLWLGMIFLFLYTSVSAGILSGNINAIVAYIIENGIPALITTSILMALVGIDEKGFRKVLGINR